MATTVQVRLAEPADAAVMLGLIHRAFAARPPVDPPAAALSDTVADIEAQVAVGSGLMAFVEGEPAGCLLISGPGPDQTCGMHRVSVAPEFREHGIASLLVRTAAYHCAELGATHIELLCRREFPETLRWWQSHGFVVSRDVPTGHMMRIASPARVDVSTSEAMHQLGRALASLLRPGDVVVAAGELGAGKTTLTQGLGAGLGVDGPVISPTFVLSRVHPNPGGGPALVHVDAYRLGSAAELEDLDLDASMASSITVVEWGTGLAEGLSDSRLDIDIQRSDDPADETRTVYLAGLGPRWAGVDLHDWVAPIDGASTDTVPA